MNELYDAIYGHEKRLASKINKIKASEKLSKANSKAILEFLDALESERLTPVRRLKYSMNITTIAEAAKKDFQDMDRADIEGLLLELGRSGKHYSAYVQRDFRIALKRFFKWLRKTDDYPDEVRWIHPKEVKTTLSPDALLTEDEIKRMADAAFTVRDKALIGILYDSGCRIGEILTLTLGKVKDEGDLITIEVDGKTGQRRIPLSEPWVLILLRTWLQNHPMKDNKNAPLFVSFTMNKAGKNKFLGYAAAAKQIKDIAARAGVESSKHVHLHLFRHTRSTELAPEMPQAVLNKRQGWVQGSRMPQIYINMKDETLDKKMLEFIKKKYGLDAAGEKDLNSLLEAMFLMLDDAEVRALAIEKVNADDSKKAKIRALLAPLAQRGFLQNILDAPNGIKRKKH